MLLITHFLKKKKGGGGGWESFIVWTEIHFKIKYLLVKPIFIGVSVVVQGKQIQLESMRMGVWSLALLSGLRIWHCRELWCRLQIWLGSCITVAVVWAGSCSSNSTSSLETCICHQCGPKKAKQYKTKQNKIPNIYWAKCQVPNMGDV